MVSQIFANLKLAKTTSVQSVLLWLLCAEENVVLKHNAFNSHTFLSCHMAAKEKGHPWRMALFV